MTPDIILLLIALFLPYIVLKKTESALKRNSSEKIPDIKNTPTSVINIISVGK